MDFDSTGLERRMRCDIPNQIPENIDETSVSRTFHRKNGSFESHNISDMEADRNPEMKPETVFWMQVRIWSIFK